jgi:hypothetical protein
LATQPIVFFSKACELASNIPFHVCAPKFGGRWLAGMILRRGGLGQNGYLEKRLLQKTPASYREDRAIETVQQIGFFCLFF